MRTVANGADSQGNRAMCVRGLRRFAVTLKAEVWFVCFQFKGMLLFINDIMTKQALLLSGRAMHKLF